MRVRMGLFVVSMALSGFIYADQIPNVEYSADSSFETADTIMNGHVYVTPTKERKESMQNGMQSVMIIRRDKQLMWMLMPANKMYREMQIPAEGGKEDISAYKMDHTTIGPDTVNDIATTKRKIIMTAPTGEKLGGFMWMSDEGIVVKMDAIAVDKKSKMRLKSELKNLEIGPQDDSLFEIPDDYTKMDMMGGMGKMMMGDDDEEDEIDPVENKEKKKRFSFKKAVDLLKKPGD